MSRRSPRSSLIQRPRQCIRHQGVTMLAGCSRTCRIVCEPCRGTRELLPGSCGCVNGSAFTAFSACEGRGKKAWSISISWRCNHVDAQHHCSWGHRSLRLTCRVAGEVSRSTGDISIIKNGSARPCRIHRNAQRVGRSGTVTCSVCML